MSADILTQFGEKLALAGLAADGIETDGLLHRCGTSDKPYGQDGAYKAFLDPPASLWWKNWRTGEEGTWCARPGSSLTAAEREALKKRIRQAREERAREERERYARAAGEAASLWASAFPAPDEHAYLKRKGVPALGLKPTHDGKLIVPVQGADGELQSLQFITVDGTKRFLPGRKMEGGFFVMPAKDGGKEGPLCIGEGYATMASVHLATGRACLVAFNAGNLPPVAKLARDMYPEREIVLCADNDTETSKPDGAPWNPGVEYATRAAVATGAKLAIPRHEGRTVDWNDLHRLMGVGEVRAQLMACCKPEISTLKMGDTGGKETLPAGFELRSGALPGLWHVEMKEEGEPVETWIGPPLHVLGATRDENGNAWGLLLEWLDPDGRQHTWAMPKALLVGRDSSTWLGRLADEGWSGAPGSHARKLLALYLTTYRTERRALCVPRTGWHQDVFVFPDAIIQNVSDVERIVLQVQTAHNPFRMGGTPDGWRSAIGEWSRGNSRIMLALCASLAAPLLNLTGQDSGGFNWTGQSSTGKTTALVAAGSVWGKGASSGGYVQNWRATSNGLEGLAALHSDAALCLDEIGQAPGHTVMEASYMLANGMGKARAASDGGAREARSWRCMVLSTGEKGLAEKIAEEGGRMQAGQSVRLIDIPADAGAGMGIFENLHGHESPQAFAEAVKHAATTHYGHAARAFIGTIQEHHDVTVSELHGFLAGGLPLLCPADVSGQVQRVARRFLLCAAAGEMAAEWELLPWTKGEALQAMNVCFEAWLALRGGAGSAEDTAIIDQVALFIEQHGASRFQDIDNPAATCINQVGFRRNTDAGTEFMILPESFKAGLCKGHNAKRAAAVLLEKGMLIPGEGRNLMRRAPVDLPGFGRKRCYTILINGGWQDVAE